jgi:hypothetical protein
MHRRGIRFLLLSDKLFYRNSYIGGSRYPLTSFVCLFMQSKAPMTQHTYKRPLGILSAKFVVRSATLEAFGSSPLCHCRSRSGWSWSLFSRATQTRLPVFHGFDGAEDFRTGPLFIVVWPLHTHTHFPDCCHVNTD